MKNIIILTVALFLMIANDLSAKVNADALDYTSCKWNSWFEYPIKHTFYAGEDVYVRIKAQNYQDINYLEIWVNNQYIRKETSYPYEWCKPGGADNYLRNLAPGQYKIKCKIVDKCGSNHYIYWDIFVTGNNNDCDWNSWFKYPKHNKHYHEGSDMYVLVDCQKYQDIEWMELYLNNQLIRRETSHPYEWCNGNGNSDYKLRNMKKGFYHLKVKIKDKCGKYHEKYCTIYID